MPHLEPSIGELSSGYSPNPSIRVCIPLYTHRFAVHPGSIGAASSLSGIQTNAPTSIIWHWSKLPVMPAHWPRIYSHTCSPGFTHLGERGDRHRERKGEGKHRFKELVSGELAHLCGAGTGQEGERHEGERESEREKRRKKEGLTCSWICR